jgi:glutamine amidotransferase
MIGIVDYGLGNVRAFANVYQGLGIPARLVRQAIELDEISHVIIPGVGAFDHTMQCLQQSGMRERLDELVLEHELPVLGVCVGMQMLAHASEEGVLPGLKWIDADVKKFDTPPSERSLAVPHMGWNDVRPVRSNELFKGLSERDSRFYFLHSYYVECRNPDDAIARTEYGGDFVCAVNHRNIFGVQFHPEKSHQYGIQLLKNFAEL